jgi:glycosyltransferase involved in cell wall biosynthesis
LTFVATGGGGLEDELRNSGVEFIRLQRRLPIDPRVALQLRRIIKERQIQVVHGHQAVEGVHLYLATLGLKNVRRVLSFHGFVTDAKNRRSLQFLIPRMSANVVVSRGLQKYLAEMDKLDTSRNFHVVYNGVDEKRLRSTQKVLREELKLGEETLIFGMIANFYRDPRKDQVTVCRALPAFFEKFPAARFVFVGGKEEYSTLDECIRICRETGIEDRVHFLGMRSDIADILHSLDVFVLSSIHEGLGIVVIEAMLAGVPCIVSDIAPLLEVSDNGKFAEIFPVQNIGALTEKFLMLARNADLRRLLAARARTYAQENFSIDAHLSNLMRLYQSL